jgi:tRNA(Ile)-lysidine synthase
MLTALDALAFEPAPHLAVAVSGGADSMALALLTHAWARARGGYITALHVDHALRPESADEARLTGGRLAALDIPCVVLTWEHETVTGNVQEEARHARYRLVRAWCRDNAVLHLLTAHHAGDQAETVAMRALRGAGIEGLSAMPLVKFFPECRHIRPLLGATHAELVAVLREKNVAWIEDPSNQNTDFDRIKIRRILQV